MNKTDIVGAIGAFIEKYHLLPKKVELPQWNFRIKSISNVDIAETSLKEYKERWTFEGTSDIEKTDEKNTVPTIGNCKIVGSAVIEVYKNPYDGSLLPDVKHVTITNIEL